MALTLVLENDIEKVKKQITCLEWQLKQDLTEKDRKIFEESLKELKEHLSMLESQEEDEDDRKRYEITCPHCGEIQYACKSIGQSIGLALFGFGICLKCNKSMNLIYDKSNDTMRTEKIEN